MQNVYYLWCAYSTSCICTFCTYTGTHQIPITTMEVKYQILFRLVITILVPTGISFLVFLIIGRLVVFPYMKKRKNYHVIINLPQTPRKSPLPIGNTSPSGNLLVNKEVFYQNLNNSSQYLRRDSFSL